MLEIVIQLLKVFGIICIAIITGKLLSKIKLPAILGWLLTGIVFGPYLVGLVTTTVMDAIWYKITVKTFECLAGVMIGREIIFKKLAKSGKSIIGITFIQSIGTFLFVSLVFAIVFSLMNIPVYMAFIFGGIALATAPAPALSIVNEFHTAGPVTKTLVPLAAIDDVIGVVFFFTVISIVGATQGEASTNVLSIVAMVLLPFVIGISFGFLCALIVRKIHSKYVLLLVIIAFLGLSAAAGLLIDIFAFHTFSLNYLLIGMSFSAVLANKVDEEKLDATLKLYDPILSLSLIIVIVNLGMPLDYHLIAGAGLFTAIYILSRAMGKIGGAFIGGKLTKAEPTVTKYLGFTLLPHSGVSLIFTGIAVTTLTPIDPNLVNIIQGTIVSAAIINEVIAVIAAKIAFKKAGEIKKEAPPSIDSKAEDL